MRCTSNHCVATASQRWCFGASNQLPHCRAARTGTSSTRDVASPAIVTAHFGRFLPRLGPFEFASGLFFLPRSPHSSPRGRCDRRLILAARSPPDLPAMFAARPARPARPLMPPMPGALHFRSDAARSCLGPAADLEIVSGLSWLTLRAAGTLTMTFTSSPSPMSVQHCRICICKWCAAPLDIALRHRRALLARRSPPWAFPP